MSLEPTDAFPPLTRQDMVTLRNRRIQAHRKLTLVASVLDRHYSLLTIEDDSVVRAVVQAIGLELLSIWKEWRPDLETKSNIGHLPGTQDFSLSGVPDIGVKQLQILKELHKEASEEISLIDHLMGYYQAFVKDPDFTDIDAMKEIVPRRAELGLDQQLKS
jgi:hypothetical protein